MAEIEKQLKDATENKGVVRLGELRKKAKEIPEKNKENGGKDRFKELQAAFTSEGADIAADLVILGPAS